MIKEIRDFVLGKKEKKEEATFPYHYAEIVYTKEAIEKGVFDIFQKQIKIWKGGSVIDIRDYSIHELIAIKKVYNIPVLDRTKQEEEEYVFNELTALEGEIVETIR